MKHAHIVYAHPEPKSFVAAMRDTVKTSLESQGWQVGVSDLYAKDFNAIASADDFSSRRNPEYMVYSLEQRHGYEHGTLAGDIRAEVEAVKAADLLVLVFPIFWYSTPAILKGWIDRVFLSGAFYGGKRVYDRGEMVGKKALIVASLGGRDYMFGPGSIHGELTGMLRHLLQGTLGYVGYDVMQPHFAYHVPYVTPEARTEMLQVLADEISTLNARPILPMPSLADFDDRFVPLTAKA